MRREGRGVIIKLGAAGDVLRTTPLLRWLRENRPNFEILWITHSPELLPAGTCEAVKPTALVMARLERTQWDFCWNLDKDLEACVLADVCNSPVKLGFSLKDGVPWFANDGAAHKFATGVDDEYSRQNTKSYPQEIFELLGLPWGGQDYWLREPNATAQAAASKILPGGGWIGLNTGAGGRWPTRLWPEDRWKELASAIAAAGWKPVYLGGPEEHEKNQRFARDSGHQYAGLNDMETFYALVARCDVLVTAVTQAMHLGIASRVPLVLFNNIFNPAEFELYGRGSIIGPDKKCDCFYAAKCTTGRNCMTEISVEPVFAAIKREMDKRK